MTSRAIRGEARSGCDTGWRRRERIGAAENGAFYHTDCTAQWRWKVLQHDGEGSRPYVETRICFSFHKPHCTRCTLIKITTNGILLCINLMPCLGCFGGSWELSELGKCIPFFFYYVI